MEFRAENGQITVTGVACFNLALTLDCGQAFRWEQCGAKTWRGVAFGTPLTICQNGDTLIFYDTTEGVFRDIWAPYFMLDTDYPAILARLSQDPLLAQAIEQWPGIRILAQEPWETLFTFIFSSTNHIKRIRGFVNRIAARYGRQVGEGLFAFPSPEDLKDVSRADYRQMGAGYRDAFLQDAVARVLSGKTDLEAIKKLPLEEARAQLMQISGVGKKVAECTLLFGFQRMEAFPVDRWIERILRSYPEGLPACFQGYEGLAQQYLFQYARMNL
ncbi:MAG: DNA-3-methyladenine glycosylase 2 family protein [Clostridiales bacterium]|nr:DNA-3-methyladenine glycosylase 2 family protein [Clostridiales bacterium]